MAVAGLTGALLVGASGPAQASAVSDVSVIPIASSSANLGGYTIVGVEPITLTVFNLNVTAHATWSGSVTSAVGYESNDVRQGANLDVTRVAQSTTGAIDTAWQLTGTVSPLGLGDIDIGTINLSKDNVSCDPKLSGGAYDCTATSDGVTLVETPGVPLSPYVSIVLKVTFSITPEGAVTSRTMTIGGTSAFGPDDVSLSDTTDTETLSMPCTAIAGDDVKYALDPLSWSPDTAASQQPAFAIGLMDPVLGVVRLPALFDAPFGSPIDTSPSFDLTGAGHTTDMGALLPNNIKPTIAPFGVFSGSEGTPISFAASTTQQCPLESYVWSFSNGTTSYGPTPQRAFGDDGTYNGQLTVTDQSGLSATQSFTVDVSNVPPVANAGPGTSGAWGKPIAFTGQAVDPGTDDQATLSYSWNWNDGTPGTGGAIASHTYATPGVKTATLTVCDDHACDSDDATVTVNARATTTSYTGANTGVFSAPVQLQASVVDEFGEPVAGAPVAFDLGGGSAGSATTGANGTASRTSVVTLPAGPTTVAASYAGSAKYGSSTSSEGFDVSAMSSTVTYTGATKGGPNKTVTLSAKLVDGLGRPLAGKVVDFALGSQAASPSPTTNSSGVATTTLKLNQKNGKYVVSATWTPTGSDANTYTGDSDAVSFSIQSK